VCYLEGTYRPVPQDDERVRELAAVVARVAAQTGPLRWHLTGLALADRGVLALAEPADGGPDAFRAAVLAVLGDHGRAEGYYRRSVWWSTVLHLASPVADPAALLAWADARTETAYGDVVAGAVDVVRYEHDGEQVVPISMAVLPLSGQPADRAVASSPAPGSSSPSGVV
jgi:hypothetical protein